MDALCKRFNIDTSRREKHNALIDCRLLKDVYINLVDQREPKLNLQNSEILDPMFENRFANTNNKLRKIVKPSNEELGLHKKYLTNYLKKNYYS